MAGNIGKALFPPMRHAVYDLVDAEHVALAHEIGTHSVPISAKLFEYRINRNAAVLIESVAPLVLRPHHRVRERPDCRNNMLDYTSEFPDVFFAVIQYCFVFFSAERRALYNPIAHLDLVCGIDPVFTEVLQRAVEAVEAFLAVTAFDAPIVCVVAEFNISVDGASGTAPTTREVDAVFRRVVVCEEQCVVVEPVRRKRAELIRVYADGPARSHFQRNEAVRRNQIAVPASVGQALSRIELSVYAPNFRKGKLGPVVKGRWHRARPAVASPPWHRSIRGRSDAICRG